MKKIIIASIMAMSFSSVADFTGADSRDGFDDFRDKLGGRGEPTSWDCEKTETYPDHRDLKTMGAPDFDERYENCATAPIEMFVDLIVDFFDGSDN